VSGGWSCPVNCHPVTVKNAWRCILNKAQNHCNDYVNVVCFQIKTPNFCKDGNILSFNLVWRQDLFRIFYSVRPNFKKPTEIFLWYFALIVICNRLTIIIFTNGEIHHIVVLHS
jgi:hypothetical protein